MVAARMRSVLVRRAPPEWQDILRKLGARIGLSRPVRCWSPRSVQVPAVVGWLRPVVLVPVGALGGLPAGACRGSAAARTGAHPAARLSGQHSAERRRSSAVLSPRGLVGVGAHSRRARTMLRRCGGIGQRRCAHVCARAGTSWNRRGPRISGPRLPPTVDLCRPHRKIAGPVTARRPHRSGPGRPRGRRCSGARRHTDCSASPDARPAFQSVSIKRNTSDWNERFRHPMGMSVNASLMLLIRFAYAPHDNPMAGHSVPLPASQVVGGPAWIDSEGYDIEAKPEDNTDPKQGMADVANAPGRPVQAEASSGDERAPDL